MNKADIVSMLAEESKITYVTVERMMNMLFNGIIESVKDGEKVHISGFGTFEKKVRAGHKCQNPRTGEEMTVNSYTTAVFRPSSAFKRKMTEASGEENEL